MEFSNIKNLSFFNNKYLKPDFLKINEFNQIKNDLINYYLIKSRWLPVQPSASKRPANSSESTSLRAHPRVTKATVRFIEAMIQI